jgi:hypothetical protein
MARSLVVVLCTLLALLASPLPDMAVAFDGMFGGDGCCGMSCCCAGDTSCGVHEQAQPRLVAACKCGHPDRGSVHGSPNTPRVCGGVATALPEPRPQTVAAPAPERKADDRHAAPEAPPPRRAA